MTKKGRQFLRKNRVTPSVAAQGVNSDTSAPAGELTVLPKPLSQIWEATARRGK